VGLDSVKPGGNETVALNRMITEISAAIGVEAWTGQAGCRPGDVPRTSADPARSVRVLGYRHDATIPEGTRRLVAWYQETHARQ
jgi:nucleoside-diphosphate-sugar epimerase